MPVVDIVALPDRRALQAIGDIGLSVACHSNMLFKLLRLSVPLVCTLFPNEDRSSGVIHFRTMYQYNGSVKPERSAQANSL
jgi:hypothetical protein